MRTLPRPRRHTDATGIRKARRVVVVRAGTGTSPAPCSTPPPAFKFFTSDEKHHVATNFYVWDANRDRRRLVLVGT